MSITFWTTNDDEAGGLNLSNVNACDLLRWLGYSPEPSGELAARDLAARCRRRLWPDAWNDDPAIPAHAEGRFVTVGRAPGYLRERTGHLLAIAERAGDGAVLFG